MQRMFELQTRLGIIFGLSLLPIVSIFDSLLTWPEKLMVVLVLFSVNIKTLLYDSTELAKRRQSGNKQMELALNLKFLSKRNRKKMNKRNDKK